MFLLRLDGQRVLRRRRGLGPAGGRHVMPGQRPAWLARRPGAAPPPAAGRRVVVAVRFSRADLGRSFHSIPQARGGTGDAGCGDIDPRYRKHWSGTFRGCRTWPPGGHAPQPVRGPCDRGSALAAAGRASRYIAAAPFLSATTAGVRIPDVLAEVNAAGRTQATAIARRAAEGSRAPRPENA